ncbi:MAG: sigma factor-like helix-turn-helix DNA-binding protein, partial [Ardenticatenaceae bacterium]
NDERERVQRVLLHIKPRSAQLLTLRYSGFSYAELAEVLKVSPRSIGTLLARAEREFERAYRAREKI